MILDTFIFNKEWLSAIEGLPTEQQDAIIGDIVRYGLDIELLHSEDPLTQAFLSMAKKQIDFSREKYEQKVTQSKIAGTKKKFSARQIYDLAQSHSKAEEIAEILGCSVSTIHHSEGWRRRKWNSFDG